MLYLFCITLVKGGEKMKKIHMKKYVIMLFTIMAMSMFMLVGCGNSGDKSGVNDTKSSSSDSNASDDKLPIATIDIEGYGEVKAELYPETAPNTVNNFIALANSGFYDNLKFHRIIKDFMIQGGDPEGNGTGGPGYKIDGEFTSNGFANNLKHTKGVLSMARAQDPNSAGSQFFIMTGDAPHLDGQYAAFGKVISGMDIIEKVGNVETKANDAPKKDVVIKSIKVDTKGQDYKEPVKK